MPKTKSPSDLSLERAAQAWCTPKTSSKVMDTELAIAFAEILDEVKGKPLLGYSTTKELIDEIAARADLDYRTVDN